MPFGLSFKALLSGGGGTPGGGGTTTLTDDLVAYWPMGEGASTRRDYTGRQHLQSRPVTSHPTSTTGKVGNSLSLNGSSQYLILGDLGEMYFGDADFSFAGWVYLDGLSTYDVILAKWNQADGGWEFLLDYTGDSTPKRFRLCVRNESGSTQQCVTADTLGAPSAATWYFIYAYHDATNNQIGIEVNEGSADTAVFSSGTSDTGSPVTVGMRIDDDGLGNPTPIGFLDGRLDEWGVWSRLLTGDEQAELYNSGSGNSTLDESAANVSPLTNEPDGAWCWFADPRAVRYGTKTHFGWVNSAGDIQIATFDDSDGLDGSFYLMEDNWEIDDHDNPTFLVRDSDSKVLVFYTKHAGSVIYKGITSSANDLSTMGARSNLASSIGGTEYTYPTPIQLTSETDDPIYLFYRDRDGSSNALWAYSKSTDGGATWSANQDLFGQDTSAYLKIATNGTDRIDFAASTHPAYDSSLKIYHWYYEGGNWYKTDGTQIVSGLPFDGSGVTTAYTSGGDEVWVWDIARDDTTGDIAIVFVVFASTSDHRYYYARWNGSSWNSNQIVAAGGDIIEAGTEVYYSGGIVIDPDDIDAVYLSREVSGQFEIYRYVTADGGSSWTPTAITSSSDYKNVRPVVIRNAGSAAKILWLYGDYQEYTDYNMRILSWAS